MKKSFLILGFATTMLFVTSCKRDYSCNCTYEEFHDDHWDPNTASFPLTELSKKDATSACDVNETTLGLPEDHRNVDCKLTK